MDESVVKILCIIGVLLIALEFAVPGLILVFLGISLLLVALFLYLGWLTSWIQAVSAWIFLSLLLIFTLRELLNQFLPSKIEVAVDNEGAEGVGEIVTVVKGIKPKSKRGRIEFQGTTWQAVALDSTKEFVKGDQVRLVRRNINTWTVESVE